MKKSILLLSLFLFGFGTSIDLYAQVNLDVNNNTNCTYSADIHFDNGSGSCSTLVSVSIPASTSFTVTNPLGTGFCESVTVTECSATFDPGPANSTSPCTGNPTHTPLYSGTYYYCPTCAPTGIENIWTIWGVGSNAIWDLNSI